MPEPVREPDVLRPSPATRWLSWTSVVAGSVAAALYATMALLGDFPALVVPTLAVLAILVGRPLMSLGGRTVLDDYGVTVHRPPWLPLLIPYGQVTWIEVRRGPLRETVVLHRPRGLPVRLRAPARLWFRADPVFDRELGEIRARTALPAHAERFHVGFFRQLAAFGLTAGAILLIVIDPPWKSDAWPFRPHALGLPDTCQAFDAKARHLMPGAVIDRRFSRGDDSNRDVRRHTCRWISTYAANGIESLSIEYELDRGAGLESDADEAHDAFVDDTSTDRTETSTPVTRTGDEARLIEPRHAGKDTAVVVAARKANVEERIEFILHGAGAETRAAAMAEEFARTGLGQVRFS